MRKYVVLILNVIIFSILFKYILIERLSVFYSCFLNIYSKLFWMSNIEYDPSGNSNYSSSAGADILNSLFSYEFFNIFPCIV